MRGVLAASILLACTDAPVSTAAPLAISAITAETTPVSPATVGATVGELRVKVVSQSGPLRGVVVAFTITRGGGAFLTPAVDTTDADGFAETTFRVATFPGVNEVSAIGGDRPPVVFSVTGVVGEPWSIRISTRSLRFSPTQDSLVIGATARDTFNNITSLGTTWVARDTNLIRLGLTPAGNLAVKVQTRPGITYIVATSGAAIDSIPVAVTDASTSPCVLGPAAVELAVGATLAFDAGTACVRATTAGAEYAVVAHLNTAASSASQSVQVIGDGITTLPSTFPLLAPEPPPDGSSTGGDIAFERRLRAREAAEIGPRVAGARAWLNARPSLVAPVDAPLAHALPSTATVGTRVSLNANAAEFCANPSVRNAKVVAVTDAAIVMADTDNPDGGFTDDEYRAIGVAMDTLVHPLDTAAFGAPTDIDGNKRVGIFFTSAVNQLTPQGSPGGIVLGFHYLRDLLPRLSAFGDCPGSNVGEMFYILVPDPSGAVNGNVRTKTFVQGVVLATVAHEYQHLINASRRMYVTNAPRVDEETWLNEGLSHIAEELVFYRSAAIGPRQNIDGSELVLGTQARTAFDAYQRGNFARYREYLRAPETGSPLAPNDQLATRGATWSFLRYVVDRARSSDGDFWRRLVDSRGTGAVNLDSALAGTGLTTLATLRDWSVSVLADDVVAALGATLQQKSWNFVTSYPAVGGGLTYALAPRVLSSGLGSSVGLIGGGSGYFRFGVPQNQEALIRAAPIGGAPLPNGTRLTIIRIK